ncbi:hypothetical protein WR25_25929 [Diploscapter pachys]|uniref:RxLR effector protein n=1 Tax=Diploscapter pachys TaxID=2018661 RepID=A0A2A2KSA0_9BILA|nr:hypothetical protein WR25_25929 [Diploscapter pachys]
MFIRLSLGISALLLAFVVAASDSLIALSRQPQVAEEELFKPNEAKRFYSWEDAKRSYEPEDFKDLGVKRKQFYAWAGKRAAIDTLNDSNEVQKRKQFYAWAGRK